MKTSAEELWAMALAAEVGIKVRSNSPMADFDELVEWRMNAANPELFAFAVQLVGKEILIVRQTGPVRTDGAYRPLEE